MDGGAGPVPRSSASFFLLFFLFWPPCSGISTIAEKTPRLMGVLIGVVLAKKSVEIVPLGAVAQGWKKKGQGGRRNLSKFGIFLLHRAVFWEPGRNREISWWLDLMG